MTAEEIQALDSQQSFWLQLSGSQAVELGMWLFLAAFTTFAIYRLYTPPSDGNSQ